MKTVSKRDLGRHAFATLRKEAGNVFDRAGFEGAPILIAGENFGCGSSREHAVWALHDFGIRAVIAPSFAEIFSRNAFKNGIIAVELAPPDVARLLLLAETLPLDVNLLSMSVEAGSERFPFEMDEFQRQCLLLGHDEISHTLMSLDAIEDYERSSDRGDSPRLASLLRHARPPQPRPKRMGRGRDLSRGT
jgi:3-isopropylmalate/(R)-2-methylmalate dehydratase small subunit